MRWTVDSVLSLHNSLNTIHELETLRKDDRLELAQLVAKNNNLRQTINKQGETVFTNE